MTIEIITIKIYVKVWDHASIKLVTPEPAIRHASVDIQVTDCAMLPGISTWYKPASTIPMRASRIFGRG